jgi:hypothetical protein
MSLLLSLKGFTKTDWMWRICFPLQRMAVLDVSTVIPSVNWRRRRPCFVCLSLPVLPWLWQRENLTCWWRRFNWRILSLLEAFLFEQLNRSFFFRRTWRHVCYAVFLGFFPFFPAFHNVFGCQWPVVVKAHVIII